MSGLDDGLYAALVRGGMSRRSFLKFSAAMATALALPAVYGPRIAAALEKAPRLPVIWLRGQDCGGDTSAFLRSSDPSTAELLLDLLSVEYHPTLMSATGRDAELARDAVIARSRGGYLAIVEGAIPTGDGGMSCLVGGRPFADIVREVCPGAIATIAVGSCAFDGGLAGADGGPTGGTGVQAIVPDARLISLPGCPVNVVNLAATVVHYLTFDELPATDGRGRPLYAYGALIHNQCERRAHFEFGEFVQVWGDEGAQKGWCLYKMGCKGPETFANCPTVKYAEGTSWPVKAGHGCIGCVSPGFWDAMSPFYRRLPSAVPFAPGLTVDQAGQGLIALVGGGTLVHGTAMTARRKWLARSDRRHAIAVAEAEAKAAAEADAAETAKAELAARAAEAEVAAELEAVAELEAIAEAALIAEPEPIAAAAPPAEPDADPRPQPADPTPEPDR